MSSSARVRSTMSAAAAFCRRCASGRAAGRGPDSGRVHYNDFMLTSTTPPMSRITVVAQRHSWTYSNDLAWRRVAIESRSPTYSRSAAAMAASCENYGNGCHPAHIYVSDAIDDAAQFTAEEFGAL